MNNDHQRIQEFLHAYVDGEVDLVGAQEIEQHLRTCEECLRIEQQIRDLHSALTNKGTAYRAPAHLQRSVRAALRREAKPESEIPWPRLALVAGTVCVVLLVAVIFFERPRATDHGLVDQVVDNHVRSLLAAHLLDVRSSDQHKVKPWFDGKVDFAPPVRDLTKDGFPLTGGRLDYLNGKTVVALIYQRNKHPINLFIIPATTERDTAPALLTRRGYSVLHWSHAEMNYWAVSDLNADELRQFAELLLR